MRLIYGLTLILALTSAVNCERLTASTAGNIVDYVTVSRADVAYVPHGTDFIVTRLIPNGNFRTAASYLIHLTYQRGCSGTTDFRFGNQDFPDLDCVYNGTLFMGCYATGANGLADPFFQPSSKVYFVSGVQFWLELRRGLRVDVVIPSEKIVTSMNYCDTFNDQTIVMEIITQNWLNRTYSNLIPYYTDDIVFSVNIEAFKYVGLPTVIAYFALGDPNISDSFLTLDSQLVYTVSSGNVLMSAYNQTIKSLQLSEGQNIYWDVQIELASFNQYNKIYQHEIFVNGLLVYTYYPMLTDPNSTKTCLIVDEYCTGSLTQYDSFEDCMDFMNSIPLLKGFYAQSVGVSDVGCRAFHASLIPALPEVHCPHSGPFNAILSQGPDGIAITPCVDQTGPSTPYVPPVSARNARDIGVDQNGWSYACADIDLCKYKRLGKQSQNLLWPQIAMSQSHEALINFAGSVIQDCINAGNC